MKKICIFDLDGTLADTLESLVFSVQETLKEMKLPIITEEQCQSFVGNGARNLMERSIQAAGDQDAKRIQEAMDIYGRIFDENCTYHVTPYEGIPEILGELKKLGIRLIVLSNKPHRQTVKVVETVFGKDCFDLILGQREGIERKPSPAGIFEILQKFEMETSECLYIGDSEVDVATGANAKVTTLAVTWGFRTREELSKTGTAFLIDGPEEIIKYIN